MTDIPWNAGVCTKCFAKVEKVLNYRTEIARILEIFELYMRQNSAKTTLHEWRYHTQSEMKSILICILGTLKTHDVSNRYAKWDLALSDNISFTNRQNAHIVGDFLNTLRRIQGPRGAPHYDIPEHVLRSLVECHFGAHDIAKLLGVSIRTIRRRMSDYGISVLSTYRGLSDYDLENEIISIISEFPHVGYRTISAILITKGHRVKF